VVLPSSEIRWLRRSAIGLVLLGASLALIALPARHALLEIWPVRVQELVLADGALLFRPSTAPAEKRQILARTYPDALLALEFHDGRHDHGFLIHADSETKIWWVQSSGGLQLIELQTLHRQYAPNAMRFGERLGLMRDRLIERRSGRSLLRAGAAAVTIEAPDLAEGEDLRQLPGPGQGHHQTIETQGNAGTGR